MEFEDTWTVRLKHLPTQQYLAVVDDQVIYIDTVICLQLQLGILYTYNYKLLLAITINREVLLRILNLFGSSDISAS